MSNPRVLVVDDETTICHVLQRHLQSHGAEVRTAHSGEIAIQRAREAAPDVVLLDIVLPGMNGVQVLAEIKKISPDTRVVMMTSHASVDSAVEAIHNGAFDYLQKPFDDIEDVWNIVQRAYAGEPGESVEEKQRDADGYRRPEILVVDDEESIRHVLTSLLEMKDCHVRQAGSTEEAIDVLKSWEPDVALVDIVLPGKSGISFLGEIKRAYPETEVLMMTSKASSETAVKAIRLGAYDYLRKPFELDEVWSAVGRALERHNLNLKSRALVEKQEEKSKELSASVSLVEQPAAEVDPEILDEFLALVCNELEVDRAELMLFGGVSRELHVKAGRGEPFGGQVPATVAEAGEPYLVDHGSDTESPIAICVPIKAGHDVLGVISVGRRRTGEEFRSEEMSYLAKMASQLAATIDGARRADQLQRAYESLKAAQRQLIFSERIKAVGQMAAGVAHDFNNVLGVILARAQFIDRKLQAGELDPAKVLEHTKTIIKTALQGAEAIKRIQDYTRIRKDVKREPVDLNKTIEDAIEIARPKWNREAATQGSGIEVQMELGEIPNVSGNRYELAQVFGNLIFNAVEAMPEGGSLHFRSYTKGDRVIAEVSDNGTGMDEETKKHLFEPFFTTKKNGQGLGTSIIFGIIGRHGGEIGVESRVGEGTTFRITLAAADPSETTVEATPELPLAAHEAARVLLVDDDELVRETYQEALNGLGHSVTACAAAKDALTVLERQPFDVVITDMSMKGMTGLELSRKIKAGHPEIAVVLSSGWAIDEDAPEVSEAGIDFVLMKPVMLDDLMGTVRRAVGKPVRS